MNKALNEYKVIIEEYIEKLMESDKVDYRVLIDAMNYSLSAGGKRIRPVLTLEFAKLCGTDRDSIMPLACAVEFLHTYSLIHDDLPCLDDDDMRRGQPSCHKQFGEAIALLAGDALLTMSFELIASSNVSDRAKVKGINTLSKNAGIHGMIGGQVLDISHEGVSVEANQLDRINLLKTSALIEAACLLGCVETDDEEIISAAKLYAKNIGLAFQITDDILDVTGDAKTLGKPIGSDAENNKQTYVSLLGIEECERIVASLTDEACTALEKTGKDVEFLTNLARYLANRKK